MIQVFYSFEREVMNKKLAAVAVATILSASAHAQSSFAGWSVGGNLNFMTTSTELSGGGDNIKFGDASQTLSVQGAYGFDMGNKFVLSVGGTYSLSDADAGGFTLGGDTYKLKMKNMYTIYVEPGYATSPSSLLYGKFAMANVKGEESFNNVSGSENFSGFGFGAGFRHMLDKNLYVQVEFMQIDFDSESVAGDNYKPSATTANVGLGYKF